MNGLLLTVIADGTPHNTGPDFGKASPLGLLVVVLLLIATLFLLRSMNRQLKKVPDSFEAEDNVPARAANDPPHPEPDQAADEGTDAVGQSVAEVTKEGHGSPRAPGSDDEPA